MELPDFLRRNTVAGEPSGLPPGTYDRIMTNVGNMSERSQPAHRPSPLPGFLVPHIAFTRVSERVGKWAYTKIARRKSSQVEEPEPEPIQETQKLSKITDMLLDPKKILVAVRSKLVDELGTFLLSNDPFIREKTAIAISEIARRPAGRQAIIRNPAILNSLINGLQDIVIDVRVQMARVLEILAHDYFSAKVLVENYKLIDLIAQALPREQNEILKEIHEKAASLVAFATITNYGKLNGLIFIDRLLELANSGESRECRLMSIKALTNIAEVPEGREKLLGHLVFIEHINTEKDRVLKKHKNILLKVIQWHP